MRDYMSNGEKNSKNNVLNCDPSYKFYFKEHELNEEFADYVKSQECKYISKEDAYYIVSREIKGKKEIFGKFTTLEFAREYERNLIIHGWDSYFAPQVSRYGKYITKHGKKFKISRTVKGNNRHYGTFNTLSEAIERREELIDNNWDFKRFKRNMRCDPNIYYRHEKFRINRYIDGKRYYFGTYDSYEDALQARDILLQTNWDYTKIPLDLLSLSVFIVYRSNLGQWEILNVIDNVELSFGLFDSREDAEKVVEILMANDWNTAYVPLGYYAENSGIRTFKRSDGEYIYSVVRRINGEVVNIDSFDLESDAIEFRNYLLLSNWGMEEEDEEEEEQFDKFLFFKDGKYRVKNNDIVYGEFDRICDASDFMKECVKKNWRMDDF